MLDLVQVYKDTMKKTLASFKNQGRDALLIFLFPIVFCILLKLIFSSLPRSLSFGAGFIQFIVSMYLLTYYLAMLYLFLKGRPLTKAGIQGEARGILSNIWTVSLVLWLVQLLLSSFIGPEIIAILLFLFVNPVNEMVYISGDRPGDLPQHFLDFYRVNGLHWLLALLIYLVVMAGLGGTTLLSYMVFNETVPETVYGPVGLLGVNLFRSAYPYLLLQVIHCFYVVFRGHLYTILSTSNPRKRAYMREWEQ